MKRIIFLLALWLWVGSRVLAQGAAPFNTSVSLSNIGLGTINLEIDYKTTSAVGDPYPNYEYSAHVFKLSSTDYRMWYGGKCIYGNDRKCQVPVNNSYPEGNPFGIGDGSCMIDSIRWATSSDGINWSRSLIPAIRPGGLESPAIAAPNVDHCGQMDPTVIKWGGKYYMYYQKEIRSNMSPDACPGSMKQCDRILYSTSTDLVNWTKAATIPLSVLPVLNVPAGYQIAHPKALVIGGEIWLYFDSWEIAPNSADNKYRGEKLIKSTDPTRFDYSAAIGVGNPNYMGNINQVAVLWPSDPNRKLFVYMVANSSVIAANGHHVPTLVFSRDGVNFVYGDSGQPVAFPTEMQSIDNEFCNIATEVNGGLNADGGNPDKISTFYYCASSTGLDWSSVQRGDISVGKINFTLPSAPQTSSLAGGIVLQYYSEFLGQKLDVGNTDVKWHINKMMSSGCLGDAQVFVGSTAFSAKKKNLGNSEYLRLLYRALLSREPDGLEIGSNAWLIGLNNGSLNRNTIVEGLMDSPEARAVCRTGKLLAVATPTITPKKQGDANNDGVVDLVDFGEWRKGYLAHSTGSGLVADFNNDGKVDLVDFGEWRKGYLAK